MKNQILLILFTILYLNCNSQITFEKGYFIDNSGNSIDCLIKNIDWEDNPTQFDYKLLGNDNIHNAIIDNVKEFGIYNVSKYIRYDVDIDRSSDYIEDLNYNSSPTYQKENHFLKVLVEGDANLYFFKDGNLHRYFFSKGQSDIKQLVYKRFLTTDGRIGTNDTYKQQLENLLICSDNSISKTHNLFYEEIDLVNYFVEYNNCNNKDFVNYVEKQERDLFNLNIRAGFNNSSLSVISYNDNVSDVEFGSELSFRFGIEAEAIMPFNKNKWSLIFEPTYQYYKSKKSSSSVNVEVDYKSIELPIGVRHYLFLNENSKLFANGSLIFDLPSSNSKIIFDNRANFEIDPSINLAIGIGFKQSDKYILEFRYHTKRNVLNNYNVVGSDYKTISLIVGYTLF